MILASQSPRRIDLLKLITLDFQVKPTYIDETPIPDEPADVYVRRLAQLKAITASRAGGFKEIVIGADTTVSASGLVLNKPTDRVDFLNMMDRLSNSTHQVFTGICVVFNDRTLLQVVRTDVTFRNLLLPERLAYWDTGEPFDKAGGYAIQGLAGRFVKSIQGSYTNVVGLPLVELEAMLYDVS